MGPDAVESRREDQGGFVLSVDNLFHIIKNRFGLRKVCYCGLAKKTAYLYPPVRIGESVHQQKAVGCDQREIVS